VATVVAGFYAADKAKVRVAGLANDVVASIHETADLLAARTPLDLDAPGAAIRKSGLAGLCQSESSCLRHVCVVEVVAQNLAIVLHIQVDGAPARRPFGRGVESVLETGSDASCAHL
jgi:hypothetical protein